MATSPNGVSGEMTDIDLVDIIDKNAPTITVTQKLENNQMNVIFRSDETVFVSGGGLNRKYGGNTNISLAIKENGVYDFTFADAAGNMTQQQITVDSIDEIPPVVYASRHSGNVHPLRGLQRKGYDVRGRNDHVPRKRISGQSTDGQKRRWRIKRR